MLRKDVVDRSPLRVLDASIDGGVGPGRLGAVLARAGIGKTAFLVQVGLDAALGERRALHVSVDMSVAEVRTWYDELFADLAADSALQDRAAAQVLVERHRMIQSYAADAFTAERLAEVLGVLREHGDFAPDVILVDGFPWERATIDAVTALKKVAADAGARLWMSGRLPREDGSEVGLPASFAAFEAALDVVLLLRPGQNHVELRLLKDHGVVGAQDTPLALHPDTMRLVDQRDGGEFSAPALGRDAYTLFSGAAPGAEALFGELAERYGLREVNYTFPTHEPARERGLTELSDRKLRQGDVSLTYVARRMNRTYTTSPTFRKILQSIWHQINNAQQVVVVGIIN